MSGLTLCFSLTFNNFLQPSSYPVGVFIFTRICALPACQGIYATFYFHTCSIYVTLSCEKKRIFTCRNKGINFEVVSKIYTIQ